ncbi:MAG: sulfatase-like hydrolase/transferase [Alphaproteobacteria bacterium]|nr:sulfatase-like hydrolase/transferase [Alphaproteobacteria bacterium]
MKETVGLAWLWGSIRMPLLFLVLTVTALDMLTTPTDWRFLVFGYFAFNAIPVILFFALIFAVTRNPKFSTIITGLFCGVIYLANYSLFLYWDSYLVPAHFQLAVADLKVTELVFTNLNFPLFLTATVIIGTAVGTSLALVGLSKTRKGELAFPLRLRVAVVLAVGVAVLALNFGKDGAAAAMRGMKMEPHDWDMAEQLKYGLFNHLYLTAVRPGLFESMLEGNPSGILEYVGRQPVPVRDGGSAPPNVVAVLAESMIDPLSLRAEFHADPLAGLRAEAIENRAGGLTRVHIVGGGTWMSEYTFLTGIPGPLFSTTGPRPFSLADGNTWTLARAFRDLGYKTVALYGARKDYIFDARATYLDLGFDRFLDFEDIGVRYGTADGTADGKVLNAIDRILREETGPTFIFAVSYDLHMPYANKGNALFVDESVGTPAMQEYFRRQSVFSAKMSKFIDEQDGKGTPLLVAMFGDHIPPMPRDFEEVGFHENVRDPLYRTPYLLHSTFGPVNTGLPELDLSYLAGMVLDQAQVDGGEYFRVNSAIRELCRGRFVHCDAAPDLLQSYYAYLGSNIATAAKAN